MCVLGGGGGGTSKGGSGEEGGALVGGGVGGGGWVCGGVGGGGGFHMNGRSCEDAAGLYVAVCTMCVCARCCKVASTHVFFAFFF